LRRTDDGYRISTSRGEIRSRSAVIASGACNQPVVPALAEAVPREIEQLTPHDYRGPDQLADGGVLVVGAAATGVQLAAELRRSGRPVTLSVGEHVRLPRTYRGRDVLWWMDASGVWNERYDEVDDLRRARRLPSPQLIGTAERVTLDLGALAATGVELVGRWAGVRDGRALFSGGLRNVCSLADLKLQRLLDGFDDWARTEGVDAEVDAPRRYAPTPVPRSPRLQLDLRSGEIRTIVWATGFRPDYGWIDVPVTDANGQLRHDGGVVVESPRLYVLGLPVLRRRKSTFIHGIEDDARDVVDHLARSLTGA
jgi:putative flavoprotein involved in K+ transport